jgi:hypothetical protein
MYSNCGFTKYQSSGEGQEEKRDWFLGGLVAIVLLVAVFAFIKGGKQ